MTATFADPRETYVVPFREALKPPPDLTVWEWADEHRVLSQVASAEPGRWVTDRTPYLREILECLSPSCPVRKVIFRKSAQVGGPLALDTPIPTVDGWTTMGEVAVGDWLFDEAGQPCRVKNVSPVMTGRDCYRIHFDDGEQIVCDTDHRWPVWDFTGKVPQSKTLTTAQMLGRVRLRRKRYRYAIDTCAPARLPERELPPRPGRHLQAKRRIVAIEPVPSVPVRCIEVDSDNHLYLCGRGWIPTHNTEAGNNWIAFIVDMVGGPMLIVQPTVELAKRWSKQRLAPMIRDTPRLHGKITDARSRDSGNTMLSKEFAGGILIVTGANSAIGLRSMPAATLFFDEVDAYPDSVNGEGHAIELGERRAQTFPFRKVFEVSTPRLKYASRIDDDFESSDRAFFYVPCPKCDTYQRLVHTQLVYEEEAPHEALYACGHCGELLSEGHKTRMLAAGQWFRWVDEPSGDIEMVDHGDGHWAPRPLDPNKPAGFHIDAMYSPVGWFSWGDVAKEKEAAKKDEARAISFQNTILGLPYEEDSDAPDWKRLHENRFAYRMGIVPAGAGVITAMCDVQRDRLEIGYYAWGHGFEGWLLDHTIIDGDTSSDQVWEELTEAANRWFPTTTGMEIPVSMFTIDMGFETEAVKGWVTRMSERNRVRAVRGEDSFGVTAIIGRSTSDLTVAGKRKRRGFAFWRIAVSSLKLETYRRLRRKRPEGDDLPPWDGPWLHYPQIGEEWFRQLTAERLVREANRHGKKKLAWKTTRPRNEALDLTVGALVGAYMLKMEQWTDDTWKKRMAGATGGGRALLPGPATATGVVSKSKKDRASIFDRKPTRARDPYLD